MWNIRYLTFLRFCSDNVSCKRGFTYLLIVVVAVVLTDLQDCWHFYRKQFYRFTNRRCSHWTAKYSFTICIFHSSSFSCFPSFAISHPVSIYSVSPSLSFISVIVSRFNLSIIFYCSSHTLSIFSQFHFFHSISISSIAVSSLMLFLFSLFLLSCSLPFRSSTPL